MNRRRLTRACVVALGCIAGAQVGAARADSCEKSRDHILASASGDLPRGSQAYLELYKVCRQSLELPNVKDAFVLKSGAVAVLPRDDGLAATAGTLAQFCTRFPRQTLRFITRQEAKLARDVARVVQLSTSLSTPCPKIVGGG